MFSPCILKIGKSNVSFHPHKPTGSPDATLPLKYDCLLVEEIGRLVKEHQIAFLETRVDVFHHHNWILMLFRLYLFDIEVA